MKKGTKIRLEIHNILYEVYKNNLNMNSTSIKRKLDKYSSQDIAFILNVSLNSMRYFLYTKKIINSFVKKNPKSHELILLISAITQVVFLGFKEYAVINCSVEIAKKLNIYHGFINALLKNISNKKQELKKTIISYEDLPSWFKKNTLNLNESEKKIILKSIIEEPNIHIVFKNKEKLLSFEGNVNLTSESSGFLKDNLKLSNLESYSEGDWWIQDYSSSFPLNHMILDAKIKCIDLCSAPGGKAFQLLSKNIEVILNDKSKPRIKLLKSNLSRLKFKAKILNFDVLNINFETKYDLVILDAPCTAVGTIRRNPEILFKNQNPDIENLVAIQEEMLNKATYLLKDSGCILYMVCSFLEVETLNQINKFLSKRSEFFVEQFMLNKNEIENKKLIYNKLMMTLPQTINDYKIDGYFAALLRKK